MTIPPRPSSTDAGAVDRSRARDGARVNGHLVVDAGPLTPGHVVLDHRGHARRSPTTSRSVVGDGADLTVVSRAGLGRRRGAPSPSTTPSIGRDARLKHIAVTLGGDVVRITTNAGYAGPGGDVEMLGIYFADAGQHQEHRLFVDHAAPQLPQPRRPTRARCRARPRTPSGSATCSSAPAPRAPTPTSSTATSSSTDGARADSVPNLEIETGEIVGRRPRLGDRPVRRRAAVLPAGPRHPRGRGPPAGRARLLRRARPADRRARGRGAPDGARSRPSSEPSMGVAAGADGASSASSESP